jgi:hypothetical protein
MLFGEFGARAQCVLFLVLLFCWFPIAHVNGFKLVRTLSLSSLAPAHVGFANEDTGKLCATARLGAAALVVPIVEGVYHPF